MDRFSGAGSEDDWRRRASNLSVRTERAGLGAFEPRLERGADGEYLDANRGVD
jgi:hypothetical protein